MGLIEWKSEFSVGDEQLDGEHKVLIGILNELSMAGESGADQEVLGSVFDRLIAYTMYHFNREEEMMVDRAFGGLDHHRHSHDLLRTKLLNLQEAFMAGDGGSGDDVRQFLGKWLLEHILGEDKKYAVMFG